MKKLYSITIILFLFALVGCSSNKTIYSENISYLPILPESTLVSHTPKDDGLSEVVYSVKKDSIESGLTEYKTIFEEDGWKIDETFSDESTFKYSKDNHFAVVIFSSEDSEIQYVVMTK